MQTLILFMLAASAGSLIQIFHTAPRPRAFSNRKINCCASISEASAYLYIPPEWPILPAKISGDSKTVRAVKRGRTLYFNYTAELKELESNEEFKQLKQLRDSKSLSTGQKKALRLMESKIKDNRLMIDYLKTFLSQMGGLPRQIVRFENAIDVPLFMETVTGARLRRHVYSPRSEVVPSSFFWELLKQNRRSFFMNIRSIVDIFLRDVLAREEFNRSIDFLKVLMWPPAVTSQSDSSII